MADACREVQSRSLIMEDLENRTFLSVASPLEVSDAPRGAGAALKAPLAAAKAAAPSTVLPLSITGVNVENGQLVAQGLIGDQTFEAPLTVTATPAQTPAGVPILNLEIGAISLDLLGLQVDTSDICLRITAETGPGNLLGNLLAGVANLLNGGTPLSNVLGGLTGTQLGQLTGGLTQLLNGAFGAILSPDNVTGTDSSSGAQQQQQGPNVTDILNLSLGPIDLNLLGLDVELDDCDGGPVTVDITAEQGPGKLLGNLLGGLSRLLDGNANENAVDRLVGRITRAINRLLA
jgi:hypothetical protein